MIVFATIVVLGTSMIHVKPPCDDEAVPTLFRTASYELYLDPSPSNRRKTTKRLVTMTLDASRFEAKLPIDTRGCLAFSISEVTRLGDEEIARRAIENTYAAVGAIEKAARKKDPGFEASALGKHIARLGTLDQAIARVDARPLSGRSPLVTAKKVSEARRACAWSLCGVEKLRVLAEFGDSDDLAILNREIPVPDRSSPYVPADRAVRIWRQIIGADSVDALHLALDPPVADVPIDGTTLHALLRMWGIERLVGNPDPRRWSPEAISVVVRAARDADAAAFVPADPRAVVRFSRETRCQSFERDVVWARANVRPWMPKESEVAACRLRALLKALAPLGSSRAFELVGVKSMKQPAMWPHFPGEFEAYRSDWKPPEGLSPNDRETAREAYVAKRWKDTDDRAPAPDLERVKAILAAPPTPVASPTPDRVHAPLPDPGRPTGWINRKACCDPGSACGDPEIRGIVCDGDRIPPLPARSNNYFVE